MSTLAIEALLLLEADQRYEKAKADLDKAARERDAARARCRPHLKPGKRRTVVGIEIGYTPCVSGRSFRLAEYLKRYKLTKTMQPFVGDGTPYDRWTVKRVEA